jgi:hypothetical protein
MVGICTDSLRADERLEQEVELANNTALPCSLHRRHPVQINQAGTLRLAYCQDQDRLNYL